MATLTSLGFNIFSTYDGNGLRRARTDLNDINSTINRTNGGLNSFTGRMSAAVQAAAVFGPALVPIGQAAAAAGAGLLAMSVAAGSAFGIFGAAMGGAILRAGAWEKSQKAATKQVDAARAALAAAKPGTEAYKNAQKDLSEALAEQRAIAQEMPPVYETWMQSISNLQVQWEGFIDRMAPATLAPAITAVDAIAANIQKLEPAVHAVAPLAQELANSFASWLTRADGLQRFIDIVVQHGVPALRNLLMAGREVITFLGIGFRSMVPLIVPMSEAIRKGATALREWAQGGGFDRFLKTVRENSGPVKEFFKALWDAVKSISKAIEGLGPLALGLTTVLLKLVAALPPEVLQAMVIGILAIRSAMLAWAIASGIAAAANLALMIIASPFFLLMAGAALTILAVVAAIVALGVGIFFLVKYWDTVWNAIKTTAQTVWTFLTQGLGQLVLLILGPIGALLILLNNWSTVWNAIKNVASIIWTALQVAWDAVVNAFVIAWQAVSGALVTAWNAVWNAIMAAGQFIWTAITTAWNAVCSGFTLVWQTVSGALSAAWSLFWNTISTVAQGVWSFLQGLWQGFVNFLSSIWNGFSGLFTGGWSQFWTTLQQIAAGIWNAITAGFQTLFSVMSNIYNTFSSALQGSWNLLWNTVSTVASTIWSTLQGLWQTFVDTVRNIYNTFSSALSGSWRLLWDTVKSVAEAVWNFLKGAWQTFVDTVRNIYNTFSGALSGSWRLLWDTVKTVAEAVWSFLKGAWQTFVDTIRNIYNTFSGALQSSWELLWNTLKDVASRIWELIKGVISDAINAILTPINMLIKGFNAIGNVFGLPDIPPIEVNFANGGMVGDSPNFAVGGVVNFANGGMNLSRGGAVGGYAPGRDTVPAMLSPGEGVLVPEAVRGLGGAGFIKAANSHYSHGRTGGGGSSFREFGGANGFADGGIVQHFLTGGVAAALSRAGVSQSLISQGEFSDGSLSAGTHMGSGVIDLATGSPAILAALINAGFAAWIRTPAQGFATHIHAILIGDPGMSAAAAAQVQSFLAGGSGLGVGGGGGGFSLLDMFGDIGELILKIVELTPIEEVLGSLFGGSSAGGLFGTGIGPDVGPDVVGAVGDVADTVTGGAFSGAGNAMLQMMYGLITMADLDKGFSKRQEAIEGAGTGSTWFGDLMMGGGKWLLDKAKEFIFDKKPEAPDTSAMGGVGGGVAQWAALAATAIQMGGLAANQLSAFLALMQAESGGNPFAINTTDINALNGVPSQGLMQVIPPTFAAYHVPGTSFNILDPLANMAAAAAYIRAVYGGNVPGSPYANGTPGGAKGWHMVGERGPEWMKFRGGERVKSNQDVRQRMAGLRGRDVDRPITINFNGRTTEEAVRRAETHLVPKLRACLQQRAGTR